MLMELRLSIDVNVTSPSQFPLSSLNFTSFSHAFFILQVSYLNYLADSGFSEDLISRNMRPTMPQLLELNRYVQRSYFVQSWMH